MGPRATVRQRRHDRLQQGRRSCFWTCSVRALEASQSTWYLGLKLRRKIWARDTFRRITSIEIASWGKKEHGLTVQDEKTELRKANSSEKKQLESTMETQKRRQPETQNEIQTLEPNA